MEFSEFVNQCAEQPKEIAFLIITTNLTDQIVLIKASVHGVP